MNATIRNICLLYEIMHKAIFHHALQNEKKNQMLLQQIGKTRMPSKYENVERTKIPCILRETKIFYRENGRINVNNE